MVKSISSQNLQAEHCPEVFQTAAQASEHLYSLGNQQNKLKMAIFIGSLVYIDEEATTELPSSRQNPDSISFFSNTRTQIPQNSSWWPYSRGSSMISPCISILKIH